MLWAQDGETEMELLCTALIAGTAVKLLTEIPHVMSSCERRRHRCEAAAAEGLLSRGQRGDILVAARSRGRRGARGRTAGGSSRGRPTVWLPTAVEARGGSCRCEILGCHSIALVCRCLEAAIGTTALSAPKFTRVYSMLRHQRALGWGLKRVSLRAPSHLT